MCAMTRGLVWRRLVWVLAFGVYCGLTATLAWAGSDDSATLILVDTSPAMSSRIGTQTRFDLTTRAIQRLIKRSSSENHIEILTYGHSGREACEGVVLDAPIGSNEVGLLEAQLNCVRPTGKLPLDLVLAPQIARYAEVGRVAKIVVVTGGYDSFDRDPCEVEQEKDEELRRNIRLSVIELGREDRYESAIGLECLTANFSGQFQRVDDEDSLYRTILNFTDSGARSRVSLRAGFLPKRPIDDATMLWQITPVLKEDLADTSAGYQPIEVTGAMVEPVLYWGEYDVRVEGESFRGEARIDVTKGGASAFELPLQCFAGHHTDSAQEPTTCLNDLEFQSCGPQRFDCRDIQPGAGFVTCNGERCDVTCEDGFHTDNASSPTLCLEDTNLKSCGVHRLDCTTTTVLGGQVGCDGAACTLTCELGKYPLEGGNGVWSCEVNELMCRERLERSERGFWASLGGGATFVGSVGLLIAQRLEARDLKEDVNTFNSAEVRPRVDQLELLERGQSIGALEGTALTLISAGALALGYAGWEYLMRPSGETFACDDYVPVRLRSGESTAHRHDSRARNSTAAEPDAQEVQP